MGIKGRRKKLREREAKERERRQRLAEKEQGEADSDGASDDDNDNAYFTGADDGNDGGGVQVMGDGPFQLPVDAQGRLKIKKSELYKLQDMEYLDRIQEEHKTRRESHLQRKRRRSEVEADATRVREVEQELLGHQYETDAVLAAALTQPTSSSTLSGLAAEVSLIEKRQKATRNGALFSHPLIGLDSVVVDALAAEGFQRMTRIQERSIPYALEGYDLLGQARTGSGKTLAFGVPVLHATKELVRKHPGSTVALMLAPTKELCVQTHDVLRAICQHIPPSVVSFQVQLITGGTKITEERRVLTAGVSIVVGTPGRIHDHVKHCKGWDLTRLRFLVLDEADRMLADGFQRDLDAIVHQLPKSRQTFLFSATNSKSVRELARLSLTRTPIFVGTTGDAPTPIPPDDEHSSGFLMSITELPPYRTFTDPETSESGAASTAGSEKLTKKQLKKRRLELAAEEEENKRSEASGPASTETPEDGGEAIPTTLRQFCHIVPCEDRLLSLYVFVKRIARHSKGMVFCSTVASTTFHFQMMGSVGFHDDVMMLHGHMKHRQRLQAFRLFHEWKTGVLFCTDVAARGLDIPDVDWILQYDPPLDPTEYIHRIGRTARAGNVGNSLLFLTPEEANFVRYLGKFGIRLEKYPMPAELPRIQENLEHVLQLDPVVAKSAVTAYRAHVGAYQSHILKETFDVRKLDLERLATAFALSAAPKVTLPKNTAEEKRSEYIKGKLRSLNRRRQEALKHYERFKTKPQWEGDSFVGVAKPL